MYLRILVNLCILVNFNVRVILGENADFASRAKIFTRKLFQFTNLNNVFALL
jgi:hypothetical protein